MNATTLEAFTPTGQSPVTKKVTRIQEEHAAMLEALRDTTDVIQGFAKLPGLLGMSKEEWNEVHSKWSKARAVLAAIDGEQAVTP